MARAEFARWPSLTRGKFSLEGPATGAARDEVIQEDAVKAAARIQAVVGLLAIAEDKAFWADRRNSFMMGAERAIHISK